MPLLARALRAWVDSQAGADVEREPRGRGGGSRSPGVSPTVLGGENVDVQSEAVQEAIRQQLRYLGGDPDTEPHLLPCVAAVLVFCCCVRLVQAVEPGCGRHVA